MEEDGRGVMKGKGELARNGDEREITSDRKRCVRLGERDSIKKGEKKV